MKNVQSLNGGQIIRAILFLMLLFAISLAAYYSGKSKAGKMRDSALEKNNEAWRYHLSDIENEFAPLLDSQDEHIIMGVIKNQKRLTLILSTDKGEGIVRRLRSDRILSKVDEFSIGSKLVFDPISRCYRVIAPSTIPMPKPYSPKPSPQK